MADSDPAILRPHQIRRHRPRHARPPWWRRRLQRLGAAVTAPLWPAWALYQVAHPLCAQRAGDTGRCSRAARSA